MRTGGRANRGGLDTSAFVLIGAGSNLGDRRYHLRSAVRALQRVLRIVRVSPIYETEPMDSQPGSPLFLNLVLAGICSVEPASLLESLLRIESRLGRRRTVPNAPRVIDLDLILYGPAVLRSATLHLPHPRYARREFVLAPTRDLRLPWVDPVGGRPLNDLRGDGAVRSAGTLSGAGGAEAAP